MKPVSLQFHCSLINMKQYIIFAKVELAMNISEEELQYTAPWL